MQMHAQKLAVRRWRMGTLRCVGLLRTELVESVCLGCEVGDMQEMLLRGEYSVVIMRNGTTTGRAQARWRRSQYNETV